MAAAVAAAMTTMLAAPVEAARMGGGRSMGKQSPSVMQRDATPAAPASPSALPASPAAQPGLRAPAAGAAAATTAAQSARSRWMAPLAGIAAGLGLAWLAHSLGFGDGLATILLIALVAMVGFALFRMLRARRAGGPQPAYAGAYQPGATGTPAGAPMAREASPQSSLQPSATQSPAASWSAAPAAATAGTAAAQPATSRLQVPAGFDTEGFVRNAKAQFIRLQAAYDAADLNDLREFTSPQMFDEVKADIDQRGPAPNRTDVVSLDAQFLGIETDAVEHTASVRFSGLIREGHDAQPAPFDEVWNLTRPVSGRGGWVLAGIQQLA